MKLIAQFDDIGEANQYSLFLRKSGILTHVSSSNSYMLSQVKTGALKVGLWVVLDDQISDARSLLDNPNYKVKSALTEKQMVDLEHAAKRSQLALNQKSFERYAAWVLGLVLVLIIGYVLYGILSSE